MVEEYDVYYTTGGGPWVNAGTDMWVNLWLELITPKLKVKPILLLHRNHPKGHEDYKFPIEAHWHGDDIKKFESLCENARYIHILHGHYTPMKCIVNNKDKIKSNVLHNSVDHILKSQMGKDNTIAWHPYVSSDWENQVVEWSDINIWVGLFEILHKNINYTNFYEFKRNLPLSNSNKLGFASRCEGRKNPHYLDGLESLIFTNSIDFNSMWKNRVKIDVSKSKVYNYDSDFKDLFYGMDWGISHSAFVSEPFGYSIFESVDYGKLPILHGTWCPDLEYPYRASSKTEFKDIYNKITKTTFGEKEKWFSIIKDYMKNNFTDKEKWVNNFLEIYNN